MNAQIEHNFKYHPPAGDTAVRHKMIREAAQQLAHVIDTLVPAEAGREKASAISNCEVAMFWACAGVTRQLRPTTETKA